MFNIIFAAGEKKGYADGFECREKAEKEMREFKTEPASLGEYINLSDDEKIRMFNERNNLK